MATENTLGQKLLDGIKAHAGTAVWVGVLLILSGAISIAMPFMSGVSVMLVVGLLVIMGGVANAILAFQTGAFGRGLALFLLGLLMVLGGYVIFTRPVAALASATLLLCGYFFVSGIIEIVAAFGDRPAQGRGWLFLSGVVTLLLGVMLWRQFPVSGTYAIGTLFGIKMVFNGTWLLSAGMAVRRGVHAMQTAAKA